MSVALGAREDLRRWLCEDELGKIARRIVNKLNNELKQDVPQYSVAHRTSSRLIAVSLSSPSEEGTYLWRHAKPGTEAEVHLAGT
jgi:hypothetical protein